MGRLSFPPSELRDSLRYYQQHRLGPELKFDPNYCTWPEIVDMIAKARKEYEKKALGLKGLIIKGWRGLGDNSSRIEPLFDLIPEDMGLSILGGGLGWILTVSRPTMPAERYSHPHSSDGKGVGQEKRCGIRYLRGNSRGIHLGCQEAQAISKQHGITGTIGQILCHYRVRHRGTNHFLTAKSSR